MIKHLKPSYQVLLGGLPDQTGLNVTYKPANTMLFIAVG